MPNARPRQFLLLCLLSLLLSLTSLAQSKGGPVLGVAPPQPVDLNLKVRREGKTEIPLRIYGKAGEPLKYFIRVPPERGHLSEPRIVDRETSAVIYDPPADLSITTDKFFYSVQNHSGVSGAVLVTITIVDQPPQLTIPDSIDFSTIRAGARNYRMLEIKNRGGLIASGEVIVEAPWKIEGKTGYQLRADEVAIFKIVFSPDAGGKFEGVARYTSDPEHSTTLRGVAEAAIATSPTPWLLEQTPGDPARTGIFELANQLDEPRTLSLKSDPRLKIPAQIQLPAHGKTNITVEAAPGDVDAWETEIHVAGNDFSIAIPVHIPGLTAILRPTEPSVAFGRLPMGKNASLQFGLENIGGASGRVSWKIGAPFITSEDSALLRPGEKKTFPLEIETKTAGRYRTWLEFTAGIQTFELPVQAEVVAAPVARPPAPVSSAAPEAVDSGAPPPGPPPVVSPLGDVAPAVPNDWIGDRILPKGVSVHDVTWKGAIIEWPATFSPALHFRVEMLQYRVSPDRKLKTTWLQPSGIPVESRGANFAALLTDLQPNQPYTVRILPLEPNGDAGNRLFAVDFFTQPKPTFADHFRWLTLTRGFLVLLAGLLVWWGRIFWKTYLSR